MHTSKHRKGATNRKYVMKVCWNGEKEIKYSCKIEDNVITNVTTQNDYF